jgi:hypothetical protein
MSENQLKEASAKYATLIKKIKDQEGEVEDLKKQRGELEQELMDLIVDSGLDQIRVTGVKMTLYIKVDTFWSTADGVDKKKVVEVLANHPETSDLVAPQFNAQSLRARMKELMEQGTVPDEVLGVLKKLEVPKIGYRSS